METTMPPALADDVQLTLGFDAAIEAVTEALASEGFGVLTRADVSHVLEAKLGVDFRPYTILGACNPPLAKRALDARPDVGLLLPCNVVVEAVEPGRVMVRIGKPTTLMNVGDLPATPELGEVAVEVAEKLERVRDRLDAL